MSAHPRLEGAERATAGEQLWSLWRPALVNVGVPAAIAAIGGAQYGFGSGWVLLATRAAGWLFVAVWACWFWWAEGQFLRAGISLNPMWRRDSLALRVARRLGYRTRRRPPLLLITWGPFRYSQAPMFLAVYSGLIAAGFLLTPWVFIWAAPFIGGMTTWIVMRERPALRLLSPEAAAWQDRTPTLVPYPLAVEVALAVVYWVLHLFNPHRAA